MVRATFGGFTTAYSALQANQKRLDLVGQNLANMNTAGYTRQQLQASSLNYSNPTSHYMSKPELTVGFGVHMDAITQIRDPYLDIQYRSQIQKSGYTNSMQESLDRLADVFDESHIQGIRQAFDNVMGTLNNMQDIDKVNAPIYESELRTRMQALTNLINDGARQLEEAKMNEYMKLDGRNTNEQGAIQQINDMLQQIGTLNRQIKQNQIFGQPSLELMDKRNLLIDELASFIPIEVTYFKDADHDGLDANGNLDESELYHLDSSGNVIAKKDWPDDLRITLNYQKADGTTTTEKIILVEGTVGSGDQNYGSFDIDKTIMDKIWADKDSTDPGKTQPGDLQLKISGVDKSLLPKSLKESTSVVKDVTFKKDNNTNTIPYQFASGSVQAGLDMLWKDGTTAKIDDVRGYDFYMDQLDNLAYSFATVMNVLNAQYGDGKNNSYPDPPNDPAKNDWILLAAKDGSTAINAHNIGISSGWISETVHINTNGKNPNNTILDMLEAMNATYPYTNLKDNLGAPLFGLATGTPRGRYPINLEHNSFTDYMNYTSTIHANDSYNNTNALKTNVTVLNGIQNSRDSVSGVSLDEEASNMMMFMSAYNAASRLLTTLDQALDVLINGTGVVGR